MRVSMPSALCTMSSCGPPPCTSTTLMPTWLRIATCSMSPRVEASSANTAPPALMTKTLPLYMRMYGAALFSARTAMDGSGRFMIIVCLFSATMGRSSQHAVQNGHLHHQTIQGLALDDRARTIEHFIRHRHVASYRQAMHELGVGRASLEPALAHAPIRQIRSEEHTSELQS